jgi:hypothetical protein
MKYDNYTIDQIDQYNWTVVKSVPSHYFRGIKDQKTGEILHEKGDPYDQLIDLGYHGDYFKALQCVLRDKAPEGAHEHNTSELGNGEQLRPTDYIWMEGENDDDPDEFLALGTNGTDTF